MVLFMQDAMECRTIWKPNGNMHRNSKAIEYINEGKMGSESVALPCVTQATKVCWSTKPDPMTTQRDLQAACTANSGQRFIALTHVVMGTLEQEQHESTMQTAIIETLEMLKATRMREKRMQWLRQHTQAATYASRRGLVRRFESVEDREPTDQLTGLVLHNDISPSPLVRFGNP